MKKVLIISYYSCDKTAIGALRLNGLAKFLPQFGWEPVVLTAESQNKVSFPFRVVQTPYEDLIIKWKRMVGLNINRTFKEQFNLPTSKNKNNIYDLITNVWCEVFAYPDLNLGWRKYALDYGNRLLNEENFDAIISSSSPVTSHLVARILKIDHNLPWIADLRDLWTQNHYYPFSPLRKFFERRLELKILSLADALTTTTLPFANSLKNLHRRNDVYPIPNGFDPDMVTNEVKLSNKFNIVHTGSLYKGKRDPELLFKAVKNLISNKSIDSKEITVDFYGPNEGWLENEIERFSLKNVAKIHGLIDRDESFKKQRDAQILLLLTWNNPDEKKVFPGKLFEYLAARRPILAIGVRNGIVEELLNETNAGKITLDSDEVENIIKEYYFDFKKNKCVKYDGIENIINKYSQKNMAESFAKVLDNLT